MSSGAVLNVPLAFMSSRERQKPIPGAQLAAPTHGVCPAHWVATSTSSPETILIKLYSTWASFFFFNICAFCDSNFYLVPLCFKFFLKKDVNYLREREQAGGGSGRARSRLPTEQEALCGAQSQDPGIMT